MTEAADFLATVARAQMRSGAADWAEAAELWAEVTAANPVNQDPAMDAILAIREHFPSL
jgi:hypothetical protein